MGQLIDRLLDLQRQHVRLEGLREQARLANISVKAKQRQVDTLRAEVDELVEDRKKSQRAADAKELEIKSMQEKIVRFRQQRDTVKTNKEYTALTNEMKFAELELRRLEDAELAEMDRVEQDQTKIEQAKARLAEAEAELEAVGKETEDRRESLAADIRKAERDRRDIADELPDEAAEDFDRIADESGAMAQLVPDEDGDSTYSCGGCHMRLTTNMYVKLLGGVDEVIHCPSCGRILYLEPE